MATLQITKKLHITPLTGVRWWLFGWRELGEVEAQGPLPEH